MPDPVRVTTDTPTVTVAEGHVIPGWFDPVLARQALDSEPGSESAAYCITTMGTWEHSPQGQDFWEEQHDAQTLSPEGRFYLEEALGIRAAAPVVNAGPIPRTGGAGVTWTPANVRIALASDRSSRERYHALGSAFYWAATTQGHDFWTAQSRALNSGDGLSAEAEAILITWLSENETPPAPITPATDPGPTLPMPLAWSEPAWATNEEHEYNRYLVNVQSEISSRLSPAGRANPQNWDGYTWHQEIYPGDDSDDDAYDAMDFSAEAEAKRMAAASWPALRIKRRNLARSWSGSALASLETPTIVTVAIAPDAPVRRRLRKLKRVNVTARKLKYPASASGAQAGCDCAACKKARTGEGGSSDPLTHVTDLMKAHKADFAAKGRTWGVEIECVVPYPTHAQDQGIAWDSYFTSRMGDAGVRMRRGQYQTDKWGVKTDNSLNTAGVVKPPGTQSLVACEFVSPPLRGAEGLAQVALVLNTIKAMGGAVNKSCGLHVHVGVRDLTLAERRNIVSQFIRYERFFDLMLPASRRSNGFARSMRAQAGATGSTNTKAAEHAILRLLDIRDERDLNAIHPIAEHGSTSHYLRLGNAVRHGTYEFRQHSGTLSPEKTEAWVRLMLAFFEAAKDKPALPFYSRQLTPEEEMEKFFETFAIPRDLRGYYRKRHETLFANPENDD